MYSRDLFSETADHYAGCAAHHMDKIAVTLLWIHARDDPVCAENQHREPTSHAFLHYCSSSGQTFLFQIVAHKTVDWEEVHRNKNIITLITKRGGHVQWHAGLSPTGHTYADDATLRFLSSALELQAQSRYS